MTIHFQVLGQAGRDNAVLAKVDSGQSIDRLLFDCGDGCLDSLSFSEVQAVDHLCFSHLHMDHVGGFDSFFRCNYDRVVKPNVVWGPPQTAAIMQCRFRGFLWNLHEGHNAAWHVHDAWPDYFESFRYELAEAFRQTHLEGSQPFDGLLLDEPNFTLHALHMDHFTPSLAYVVREKPRQNIDVSRLAALGLRPGPWLKQVKEGQAEDIINIEGASHTVGAMRERLVVQTPGESLAYLTDFLLDEKARERLTPVLAGCTRVVCEAQYRHDDLELARRNHHMTTRLVAELARDAGVGELTLFHVSDRYQRPEWLQMLAEAQAIFPRTGFPSHWRLP